MQSGFNCGFIEELAELSAQAHLWELYKIFEATLSDEPEFALEQECTFIKSVVSPQSQDFYKVCLLPISYAPRAPLTTRKSAQFRVMAMNHHLLHWRKRRSVDHENKFEFHRKRLETTCHDAIESVKLLDTEKDTCNVSSKTCSRVLPNDDYLHHTLSLCFEDMRMSNAISMGYLQIILSGTVSF